MPRIAIVLTLVLIAASGIVAADNGSDASPAGCADAPPREERPGVASLSLEIEPGRYLYLPTATDDVSALEKAGFWEESNLYDGLQTESCWKYDRLVRVYARDTHQGLAFP